MSLLDCWHQLHGICLVGFPVHSVPTCVPNSHAWSLSPLTKALYSLLQYKCKFQFLILTFKDFHDLWPIEPHFPSLSFLWLYPFFFLVLRPYWSMAVQQPFLSQWFTSSSSPLLQTLFSLLSFQMLISVQN